MCVWNSTSSESVFVLSFTVLPFLISYYYFSFKCCRDGDATLSPIGLYITSPCPVSRASKRTESDFACAIGSDEADGNTQHAKRFFGEDLCFGKSLSFHVKWVFCLGSAGTVAASESSKCAFLCYEFGDVACVRSWILWLMHVVASSLIENRSPPHTHTQTRTPSAHFSPIYSFISI